MPYLSLNFFESPPPSPPASRLNVGWSPLHLLNDLVEVDGGVEHQKLDGGFLFSLMLLLLLLLFRLY